MVAVVVISISTTHTHARWLPLSLWNGVRARQHGPELCPSVAAGMFEFETHTEEARL